MPPKTPPPPDDTPAAEPGPPPAPAAPVVLRVRYPHVRFDPGDGLAPVTQAGTAYSTADADRVRTAAARYRVPLHETNEE